MITAVMIDSREPTWVQQLTFGGKPTAVMALAHGDLQVCCDDGAILLVERKTPDDFLGSLRDDRLFTQLSDMKNFGSSAWCYLCITGEFLRGANGRVVTSRETGWDWQSVMGALLSIQEMGVMIVWAAGDADYEATITRLAARRREGEMLVMPPRVSRVLSISESILASLPGIGLERVQAVMKAANGVAAWGLVGLTDNDWECEGIGPAVKRNIRAALGLKPNQELMVVTNETK